MLESAGNAFGPLKVVMTEMNPCIDFYDSAAKGREGYNQLSTELGGLFSDLRGFLDVPVGPTMTHSIKTYASHSSPSSSGFLASNEGDQLNDIWKR